MTERDMGVTGRDMEMTGRDMDIADTMGKCQRG